ncbi:hypothetical protein KCTC52924_02949 [Arenibacter antarcticus]|uniref:Insulinase family protein n=1 Tax=Arenibacter antarcticus TaxID=2040469 RepID=A0ABW5VGV1_9FLAO|nr:M16 family metallopeptidase [Arenibacter sp. H213]
MKYIAKRTIKIIFIHLLFIQFVWADMGIAIQDTIPIDPSIRYGRLPNGFTYYIKNVPHTQKVLMDLYVKVGAYHQNPDQMDYAHAIEHLAFSTADHFPGHLRNNVKRLSQLGINLKDNGGNTGHIYTVYNFNIPINNNDALDMGLQWFRDISDLKLTTTAINGEKGVLRQEIMYGVGHRLDEFFLEKKLQSKLFPCNQDYSNLLEHNISFSPQSLIEFYKKWYRPDRMGLIITGNIKDMDAVENHVKERFSNIPIVKPPPQINTDCRLNYLQGPSRFVALGRKQNGNDMDKKSVEIYLYTRDKETLSLKNTREGLQRRLVWSAIASMFNSRISEDKRISGGVLYPPEPYSPFYQIVHSVIDNTEQQKIQNTIQLLQQVKTKGFTPEEWEDARKTILRRLGNTNSATYWKEQMANHFVYHEALPENKKKYLKQWLIGLSLKDINLYAGKYLSEIPNDIGIIAPTGHRILSISESKIREWIRQAIDISLIKDIPLVEKAIKPLISDEQVGSLKEVGYAKKNANIIGVNEFLLDNGVKVVIHNNKLSGRLKDRILIHGFSPKGALCFPEVDYFSAINAPLIVKTEGIGGLSGTELQDFISKHNIYLNHYIDPLETGIKVDGTLSNLENMLQLVYLYHTKPKKIDKKNFERWKQIERKWYINPSINPVGIDFSVLMGEVLNDKSMVLKGGTKRFSGISKTDKDRAFEIYIDLFENASDFTFILSGDFSRKSVLPLIQKYLGNLSNNMITTCDSSVIGQIKLNKGPQYHEFLTDKMKTSYLMKSVKYMLRFISKAEDSMDWKERIRVVALGRLINFRLNKFRYENGGALYNFSAHGVYNRYLESYSLGIYLDCTQQELEWLRQESKNLISEIKENGFNHQEFEEVFKNDLSLWYINGKGFTQKEIYGHYRYNDKLINKKEQDDFMKSLTLKDIQRTAIQYLKDDFMIEFIMRDSTNP